MWRGHRTTQQSMRVLHDSANVQRARCAAIKPVGPRTWSCTNAGARLALQCRRRAARCWQQQQRMVPASECLRDGSCRSLSTETWKEPKLATAEPCASGRALFLSTGRCGASLWLSECDSSTECALSGTPHGLCARAGPGSRLRTTVRAVQHRRGRAKCLAYAKTGTAPTLVASSHHRSPHPRSPHGGRRYCSSPRRPDYRRCPSPALPRVLHRRPQQHHHRCGRWHRWRQSELSNCSIPCVQTLVLRSRDVFPMRAL